MKVFLIAGVALLASGCSWVELTPGGDNVAVLSAAEVTNCTAVGVTTVAVQDRVVVQRTPETVEEELRTLARNSAAQRGGDTVVASGVVQNGQQSYDIYRCRR